MRVEVDVSDLIELVYFRDKRCEEIEEVLRKDPKYAECIVKRRHFDKDWELDPFVIQDSEGKDLVTLDTWEVDALSNSELLSYTDIQINREQHEYLEGFMLFIMILIIIGPLGVVFSIGEIVSPSGTMNPIILAIGLTFDLIFLLSVIRFYRKRKDVISKKRHIDLIAARENSTFLDALRKLASLSNIDEWKREEYMSRLQCIEDSLSGAIS